MPSKEEFLWVLILVFELSCTALKFELSSASEFLASKELCCHQVTSRMGMMEHIQWLLSSFEVWTVLSLKSRLLDIVSHREGFDLSNLVFAAKNSAVVL
jgi:hypothetical protein